MGLVVNQRVISNSSHHHSCHWGKISRDRLRYVKKYAADPVLDVGCATGDYVCWLNQHGYRARGVDMRQYREWEQYPYFDMGALPKLHYASYFDTVLCFEVIEHVEEKAAALAELRRLTGRTLILSVPNCERLDVYDAAGLVPSHWLDRTHVNFFTRETLLEALYAANYTNVVVNYANQIKFETLLLACYRFPLALARAAGYAARFIPFRRQLYMSLIAVAEV